MRPYWQSTDGALTIYHGDAAQVLSEMPDGSVQTCVTSPPYWGLRDYGTAKWEGGDPECDHRQATIRTRRNLAAAANACDGGSRKAEDRSDFGALGLPYRDTCGKCGATRIDKQIGLEESPEEYVANMVEIFRGVRRVLRDDGTVWLNLGDSYAGSMKGMGANGKAYGGEKQQTNTGSIGIGRPDWSGTSLKPKDLCMIPARVALALQADGWWLRSDIIWAKTNPMPESVRDRPTNSHEHIFLLAKSARYWYDADAIREGCISDHPAGNKERMGSRGRIGEEGWSLSNEKSLPAAGRNKRNVWTVNTQPFPGAHFAVFSEKLIEPCVLAGSAARSCAECGAAWERVTQTEHKPHPNRYSKQADAGQFDGQGYTETGGLGQAIETQTIGFRPTCDCDADTRPSLVLDPFGGAGTTLLCAYHQGRRAVMCELSEEYCELAKKRLEEATDQGRLFEPAEVATAQPAQLVMEQDAEG